MTADILPWSHHVRHHCPDDCPGCIHCEGCLFLCDVCGGAEGDLLTDCPGCKIPEPMLRLVASGVANYTRKDGWTCYGEATLLGVEVLGA